jgi:ABC-2 type transport system ATP-binding protein
MIMNGKIKADSNLKELSRTNNVILILEQDIPGAVDDLKALPGVQKVKKQTSIGQICVFTIEGKTHSDLTPIIYRLAAEKQWPVRELRNDVRTLESVFNELAIAA